MVAAFIPNPFNQNIPRSYIRGIALYNGADDLTITPNGFTFWNLPDRYWIVECLPGRHNWNSNTYSLDQFFDPVNSRHFVNGIEVGYGGMYIQVGYIPNHFDKYIKLFGYSGSSTIVHFDLPLAPADYWLPYSD